MEIHQKKAGPDHHRLKTMVERSIEQNLHMKNFGIRNGNFEKNAVVKNKGTKQRVQRTLGDCKQWETNGQCVKGDNCSSRHDMNKRGKATQPNLSPSSSTRQNERKSSRTRSPRGVVECLDCPERKTSKELAPIHYVKNGILQNACSTSRRRDAYFGEKCSYAHRQVDEQPSKRSKNNGDKRIVAMLNTRQFGLRISGYGAAEVFIDFTEELKHTETNPMYEIHKSRRTSC